MTVAMLSGSRRIPIILHSLLCMIDRTWLLQAPGVAAAGPCSAFYICCSIIYRYGPKSTPAIHLVRCTLGLAGVQTSACTTNHAREARRRTQVTVGPAVQPCTVVSTVAAVRRAAARPSASARFSVAARLTTNSEYSTCFLLCDIIGITHCYCGIVPYRNT